MERSHEDITIPSQMLSDLGLAHHIINCPSEMTQTFAAVYRANTQPSHEEAGIIAQGLLDDYPKDRVCLTGHASVIARCFYYSDGHHPEKIDAKLLTHYAGMCEWGGKNEFVEKHFDMWLKGAKEVERRYRVRVLDLFYWEQRVGSWAANGESQWDIVHDRLPVFACREVLTTMLSVDIEYRKAPSYKFYKNVMQELWPEVLAYPINPASSPGMLFTTKRRLAALRRKAIKFIKALLCIGA